jgi:sugar lactone lactonase YvrE
MPSTWLRNLLLRFAFLATLLTALTACDFFSVEQSSRSKGSQSNDDGESDRRDEPERADRPVETAGTNLCGYENCRVSCGHTEVKGKPNTYQTKCDVLQILPNGQTISADGLKEDTTLAWNKPLDAQNRIVVGQCYYPSPLTQICDVEVTSLNKIADATVGFTVAKADNSVPPRDENKIINFGFSVSVYGYVPSVPFKECDTLGGEKCGEEESFKVGTLNVAPLPDAVARAGNNLRTIAPDEMAFDINSMCKSGDRLYFSSLNQVYYYNVENHEVHLFAGSQNALNRNNFSSRLRHYFTSPDSGSDALHIACKDNGKGKNDLDKVFVSVRSTGELLRVDDDPGPMIVSISKPGELDNPMGIAVGHDGVIYVADKNHNRIVSYTESKKVSSSYGMKVELVEQDVNFKPWSVAVDKNREIYIADYGRFQIKKFPTDWKQGYGPDTNITRPKFVQLLPTDDADVDPDFIAIGNDRLSLCRKNEVCATVAAVPNASGAAYYDNGTIFVFDRTENKLMTLKVDTTSSALEALLPHPKLAYKKVDAVAESAKTESVKDAKLFSPVGLTYGPNPDDPENHDKKIIYFADRNSGSIRRIIGGTPDQKIEALKCVEPCAHRLEGPTSLAFYGGNLFVVDSTGNQIKKLAFTKTDLSEYNIEAIAGTGTYGHSGDGKDAGLAKLAVPISLAVDSSGTIYFSEESSIRKLQKTGLDSFYTISSVKEFAFNTPMGIALPNDHSLYVSDSNNHQIKKIDLSSASETVAVVAGISDDFELMAPPATAPVTQEVRFPAAEVQLNAPADVHVDRLGNTYIADTNYQRIRMIDGPGLYSESEPLISTIFGAESKVDCGSQKANDVTNDEKDLNKIRTTSSVICNGKPQGITSRDTCDKPGGYIWLAFTLKYDLADFFATESIADSAVVEIKRRCPRVLAMP